MKNGNFIYLEDKGNMKIAGINLKSLLFDDRTTKQTIFKNIIWLTVGMGINRTFKAVLVIYADRFLGWVPQTTLETGPVKTYKRIEPIVKVKSLIEK